MSSRLPKEPRTGPQPRLPKVRLDERVVELGLAPSKHRAQAFILAGKVLVGGEVCDKAGKQIAADAEVSLREPDHPYVSRGGLKLAKAVDEFALAGDIANAVCLDVGASTGGFTDVLLQNGARHVVAIDVGNGQLAWRLATDSRVTVLDRTNIRYLERSAVPADVSVVVCDVSFISLQLVLPKFAELAPSARFVALIKPQFEVGPELIGKGGVVRDAAVRAAVVERIQMFAKELGFTLDGTAESPITGPAGNVEYLLCGRCPA